MIRRSDLFKDAALHRAINEGYVRQQVHPSLPLAILNYTAQAQWERAWNDVTRQCRGLIYNLETDEVVARPWPKFFNWGELVDTVASEQVRQFDLDEPVRVFDKMDGSLGIAYTWGPDTYIATRGSFTSSQALVANTILAAKYPSWQPKPGLTYLFEIIYPENRIVVDYAGMEDLVLLDILETDTGEQAYDLAWYDWPGPYVDKLDGNTLREALALEPRPNAEGIVIRFEDDTMLKVKQEDYVELHRIVTGLSERTVWEHLMAGRPIGELLEPLPDEFHTWVLKVEGELRAKFKSILYEAQDNFQDIQGRLNHNGDFTRKEFAAEAVRYENPFLLFLMLDGKPLDEKIWKMLRPKNPQGLVAHSEDVA